MVCGVLLMMPNLLESVIAPTRIEAEARVGLGERGPTIGRRGVVQNLPSFVRYEGSKSHEMPMRTGA